MSIVHVFEALVIAHMTSGSVGLVAVWLPIIGKKGGPLHKKAGKVFVIAMLFTGTFATGISLCTLTAPIDTHPHLMSHPDFGSAETIRGVFGWMMLYLAFLTINLAWYGWRCVVTKRDRASNRRWENLLSQSILLVLSVNCLWVGYELGHPLVAWMSFVGLATVATNMWFLFKPNPGRVDWLQEHIKGLVGAGISVYTAFFAFGAVRYLPEAALTPFLWSIPLVTGLTIIIFQQFKVRRQYARA
jgi:hypothetical protein